MSEISNKLYFVTGGGTGGHIYPAMAVADALTEEGALVYYVGNRHNMEFELASKKNYKFLHVGVKGMPRGKNLLKIFTWGLRLLKSILYSIRYIKKYKPNAVFATGGYVSAPMVFACIITKTPYMMHDCDAMPGLVTRKLCKKAKYITLAFERAKRYLPVRKSLVIGNPIRKEFSTLTKEQARENLNLQNKITLTVMGGSQGAKSINETILQLLKEFVQDYNLQIIFQTGKKNYDEIFKKVKLIYPAYENDGSLIVRPYFDDMISVLKASDIVISRAGSLSISEICASNVAPILVPYPYAAADHQRINAKCVLDAGACVYVEDSELEPNKLKEIIVSLIKNPVKMNYLKQNSSNLAKLDATEKIIEKLKSI